MAPIKKLCQSLTNYQSTTFSSGFIFYGDVSSITLSILCSSNCSLVLSYAIDEQLQVVNQETYSIIANNLFSIVNKNIETRYMSVDLNGITVGSTLKTQAFYYV